MMDKQDEAKAISPNDYSPADQMESQTSPPEKTIQVDLPTVQSYGKIGESLDIAPGAPEYSDNSGVEAIDINNIGRPISDLDDVPQILQKRSVEFAQSIASSVVSQQNEGGGDAAADEQNQGVPAQNNEIHQIVTEVKDIKQKRKSKESRKIPRYESESIDEEEFQDYFTNPIKRKDFDRQRKKQQQREMQNITGFALGKFGIKSIKQMKEQLPDFPEDDEEPDAEGQKNYATVSLCCLSVTNPFRNKIIQIVSVNPLFDRFILLVIVVNCIFLALDKEVDGVTNNIETIDFVFLLIYTWEMTMKIIAMGFVMREHSYLRDSWNIMDFSVVSLGWFSKVSTAGDISAIKVIRILRPLRAINQIPNMSQLVATILKSIPVMIDVALLFGFMLIMFGTIGCQLLGGTLEKRCVYTDEFGEKFTSFVLGEDGADYTCLSQQFCDDMAEEWEIQTQCEYVGNPISDTYAFDNVLLAIMNIFEMITLEGWTDMMYIVRDAQGTLVYDFFFVMCVVVGNFIILNLLVAVQSAFLDKAFDEEAEIKQAIVDKLEARKKLKKEIEDAQEYDSETESEEVIEADEYEDDLDEGQGGRRGTRKKVVVKSIFDTPKPEWLVKSSNRLEEICETTIFERTIITLIMLNTLSLASEHYEEAEIVTQINDVANMFFTVIFAVEMVMKLYGFGCAKYASDSFNLFDAFIVTMSYVELVVPKDESGEGGGGLGMLKAFRLLRIFKIIKSWESLKVLLGAVLGSLGDITNLGILIFLFLFIFALLCKQFFAEPLLDDDGGEARYAFGDTYTALITMFIVLTGENWNEVMILVISNRKSFVPSVLFIFMMLLGNMMLLNLFLAILLKSISGVGDDDDDAEGDPANDEDEEADAKNALGGLNESAPLNSSNSNIMDEFDQIKKQLMAISGKGTGAGQQQNEDEDKPASQADSQNEAKEEQQEQAAAAIVEEEDEEEKYKKQMSLFIFSYDNPIRRVLRDLTEHAYFAGFVYHIIGLNSLLLALDEPSLEDPYQKQTINFLLETISIIFVGEFAFKVLVQGFYWGERTYMKDAWNILDFVIVFFTFVTWFLEAYATGDVSFLKGFRALRALRPLKIVSKNEGVKTVVQALLESIPALINVLMIVVLFLLVFGILGIQLFKGQMGVCNDESDVVTNKTTCVGEYLIPVLDRFGREIAIENFADKTLWNDTNSMASGEDESVMIEAELAEREWSQPFNRYDNVFISMITFFEIATLEMWPDMMFAAIDARGYDLTPREKNSPFVSILYVIYIFIVTFFIVNLFVSVIVDKFNEQIKKRQGSADFTDSQKEWVKIMRLLMMTDPKLIPVEPINAFRLQCFRVVQSQFFEYIVMITIVFNTFFLCIDYHQKSDSLALILVDANLFFVVFFTVEMVVKITAYGWTYYWYVSWNKFDFVIVMLSLVAVDEALLESMNVNVTILRIMRVARLIRLVKTSESLRSLMKTLIMSMPNIFNTAALLALIVFTFSVAGMSLLGNVPGEDFVDDNVNFRSFYIAFMTLFRAATGESWNGIMHDCYAGEGIIAILFWLVYTLLAFFIFMNVFIAVIGESFDDNQQTEDENDILALKKKDIKAFRNTWAKYNPMGELYMRTSRLTDFLRELPPPLGYQGIRIEDQKLNKIIFCLNIRDHLGRVYYPEVMWTIFHSIAGMNDEKVLRCKQIKIILKTMQFKYRGLGKKVHLDVLCGNKYYRNQMTAIKYIQAMKILNKWRLYKDNKRKRKIAEANALHKDILHQQLESPQVNKIKYEEKQEMEGGDVQYMGGEQEVTQEDHPTSCIEHRYKMIQMQEIISQQYERKLTSSVLNDEESNKTTQEDESTD